MTCPLAGFGACVAVVLLAGCAGSKGKVEEPKPVEEAGAPVKPAAPPAASERPFASTPLETQSMIQREIDVHRKPLWKCVEDYRTKVGDPHLAVTVDIGIDQEGHLIGVTEMRRGGIDPTLQACMTEILRVAAFPRSHTGVITVKQVFQDAGVYR